MASAALTIKLNAAGNAAGEINKVGAAADRMGSRVAAATKGISDHFTSVGKSMMSAGAKMTAGFTLPIVAGFKKSIDAARESNAIGRVTESVIKATGGAANLTAKQIGDLAGKISMNTGVSDEAIQAGENILLTFKKVGDVAGKNNDIFTRATKATVDLAAVFGGDASTYAKMLGTALNDPAHALGRLKKAGVDFTEQQKKQIETMVKVGDTLGAQKIIMAEIESQVGGAAAAAGDPMAKLGQIIDNIQETIGNGLLPVIEKAAKFINDLAVKFQNLSPHMQNMIVAGLAVAAAIGPVITVVGALVTAIGAIGVGPFLLLAAGVAYAATHFDQFKVVAQVAWDWLKTNIPAAIEIIKGKILEFVTAVGAWWAQHQDQIMAKAQQAWNWIKTNVPPVLEVIKGAIVGFIGLVKVAWDRWGDDLVAKAREAWNWVKAEILPTLSAIKDYIITFISTVKTAWQRWGDDIKQVASTIWNGVAAVVRTAIKIVEDVITAALRLIRGDWSGAWDKIKAAVGTAWDGIVTVVRGAGSLLWSAMTSAINFMLKAITTGIQVAVIWFGQLPGKIVGAIPGALKILWNVGVDIVQGLINGIKSLGEKALKAAVDALVAPIPDWAKAMLGINSPAKTMIPIGEGVVEGVIVGIDGKAGAVAASVKTLTDRVKAAAISPTTVAQWQALGESIAKALDSGVKGKTKAALESLKKFTDSAIDQAQKAAARIDAAISAVLGRASAGRGLGDAKQGQSDAEADLNNVRKRASTIGDRLSTAEARLAKAREEASKITAEEQDAIEQATEAYKKAQEQHANGEITDAALEVVRNRLTKAQQDAIGPTSDVTEAEQELATIREEQANLAGDLVKAEKNLEDAKDRVTEATIANYKATLDGNAAGADAIKIFTDWAKAAGLTADQIDRVVSSMAKIPTATTTAPTAPQSTTTDPGQVGHVAPGQPGSTVTPVNTSGVITLTPGALASLGGAQGARVVKGGDVVDLSGMTLQLNVGTGSDGRVNVLEALRKAAYEGGLMDADGYLRLRN